MVSNQATSSTLAQYQNYPLVIRRFLATVDKNPVLTQLFTKSGIRVLIDILSRTPIKDSSRAIRLRMDRVASVLGISEKTVQRVLNALLRMNWISRASECTGRNYFGRFSYRKFIVGKELRSMMGLSTDSVDDFSNDTKNLGEMSNGVYKKRTFFKESLLEKSQNTELSTKGVPKGLVEMNNALGLGRFTLGKLMGLAKKNGIWMQNLWEKKKNTILNAGVKGFRAFFYLRKLILAYDVRNKVSQEKEKSHKDKNLKDDRRHWHKRFFDAAKGLSVQIFEGTAEILRGSVYVSYICPSDMPSIYEAIKLGRLKEVIR